MIRSPYLFAVGIVLAGVGVYLRYGALQGEGLAYSPVMWGGAAMLVWIASGLVPGKRHHRPLLEPLQPEPVPLSDIAQRIIRLLEQTPSDIPLVVDFIIFQAIAHGASDIHFDPGTSKMAIKFRIQGMMKTVAHLEAPMTGPVTNRLKIISNLIIYKEHTPQDGRFDNLKSGSVQEGASVETKTLRRSGLDKTDFRIAFMPTLHGERIVIRILNTVGQGTDLLRLGFDTKQRAVMRRLIAQPQGMIIFTGPTGSGKTTTIFSTLQEILSQSGQNRSVATLEDPIEFDYPDINQSQVDEERGFSFDKGLRAVLRQDPDVIMVGEIRDSETARIAMQAGMTGHLLITTVHAGITTSVFARLGEMGIPAYSMNSAITAVIAQRLVRTLCSACRRPSSITPEEMAIFGDHMPRDGMTLYTAVGCDVCNRSGYQGRSAIYEILEVTEALRKQIADGADSEQLYKIACSEGLQTLWQSGLQAVMEGRTTLRELQRAVASLGV